jgi:ketosteroid isomerase-like protein
MSAELKDLSRAYVAAFNARNVPGCAALMADDFALEDPVVKRVEGRDAAMRVVEGLFASCNKALVRGAQYLRRWRDHTDRVRAHA